MNNKKMCLFLCMMITMCCLQAPSTFGQVRLQEREGAKEGDTVWIIVNYVKPDKREQFERFVYDIFWPASKKLTAEEQQLFNQTRILNPTGPDEDGTYPYIFLIDPRIPGGNYEIEPFLVKMYGEEKAQQHIQLFNEAVEGEQKQYLVVQSKY